MQFKPVGERELTPAVEKVFWKGSPLSILGATVLNPLRAMSSTNSCLELVRLIPKPLARNKRTLSLGKSPVGVAV